VNAPFSDPRSMAERVAHLTPAERDQIFAGMSEAELAALEYDWRFWGRPAQIAPDGDWSTWLALAGRGFGKTEMGARWIDERVTGGARMIALIAETQKDLEEVMVPRIVAVSKPGTVPSVRFKPVRMIWPNGAMAYGYNGTEPDQLRGPEFDTAWVDELAKYKRASDLWDMLQFTMRKSDPRVFVSTTPRPIPVLRTIMKDKRTVITRGSTMDNRSNLPDTFLKTVIDRYAGTRLGRQELNAEILEDVPGALWTREMFDKTRIRGAWDGQAIVTTDGRRIEMQRIVIGVDPSGSKGDDPEKADDIGIIAAGKGTDGRGYVLGDWTCNMSPAGWGKRAVEAYRHYRADCIVAERNFGGEMVRFVIVSASATVPVKLVTASRGKTVRAEPIASLYEQGKVSHLTDPDTNSLELLEDQACQMTGNGYVGDGSPDRVDAKVWALSELMLDGTYDWASSL